MLNTLRISFALKNTYRVNGILYGIRQIPLLKKVLPVHIYRVRAFKIIANIFSALWEIVSAFLGKLIYFLLLILLPASLYPTEQTAALFLHLLIFNSLVGAFLNNSLFPASKDRYYALILLNMDTKKYTLISYCYGLVKILVGYTLFGILFGGMMGVPLWQCILIPFFVDGIKITASALSLRRYEKRENSLGEPPLGKLTWPAVLLLLAAAYGLPAANAMLPISASVTVMCFCIAVGILLFRVFLHFPHYRTVYREILLDDEILKPERPQKAEREQSQKTISTNTDITSRKQGFEYLNELFIKRHRRILWRSSLIITAVCAGILVLCLAVLLLFPTVKTGVNQLLLTALPWFLFIMYAINRGTGFTRALFINCDHSLLTYSVYKKPGHILKLFQIRLREIVRINLLPAVVIGFGLSILLFASGGTNDPLNYAVLAISIPAISVFFSVHYLTVYYLLQPYNAETEIKSGMYKIIMGATYLVCYFMMQVQLSTLYFGLATILFCLLYCAVASILVYKLAPKTFRLRQ